MPHLWPFIFLKEVIYYILCICLHVNFIKLGLQHEIQPHQENNQSYLIQLQCFCVFFKYTGLY